MLSYVISRKSNLNWLNKKNFIQEIHWKSKSSSSAMTRTWLFSISQCCDLTAILGSFSYVQKVTTSSFPGSASSFNQQKG